MSDRDPRDMRDTPDVGFGIGGGNGNGRLDLLMMQVNDLTSKLGTIQNENMQLRHSMSSLPHPPNGLYGAGYSGTNGPMPMAQGGMVTTFAPPAGSMMQGLNGIDQARASQRFANTRNLTRSRERLLDEGDDLEGG